MGQLAVQVLAAVLLLAVVGVGLFDFSIFLKDLPTSSLVLLRALRELPELGIELREAPRDPLDAGVQASVLAVLSVEVIFVALALLRGGDGGVFSGEMGKKGQRGLGGCSREPGSVHSQVASPNQEAALTPSRLAVRNTHTATESSHHTRVHTDRNTHTQPRGPCCLC